MLQMKQWQQLSQPDKFFLQKWSKYLASRFQSLWPEMKINSVHFRCHEPKHEPKQTWSWWQHFAISRYHLYRLMKTLQRILTSKEQEKQVLSLDSRVSLQVNTGLFNPWSLQWCKNYIEQLKRTLREKRFQSSLREDFTSHYSYFL